MKTKPLFIGLALVFLSPALLADDDCDDPLANWQPRENLRQKLQAEGWTVYRIKVDDGCYEVKGLTPEGYRAEASFAPASLKLMELEREEDDDDDHGHSNKTHKSAQASGQVPVPQTGAGKSRPRVTIE
ncbi:PepSY domain-containing protein [Halopseudomonas pelagia]|uniref:PepSY domain-containing protein n=1 Tax=Halopseudomonas pelagia TaxID=553151 RepID=UPI0003A1C231|nr:PepSY domain-containing protein [Halopseudomonas pelagia]|tara:strand:+ start:596 stop:982 length:387 start_codon:yes stop_codon:yes gene_type:complete